MLQQFIMSIEAKINLIDNRKQQLFTHALVLIIVISSLTNKFKPPHLNFMPLLLNVTFDPANAFSSKLFIYQPNITSGLA